MCEWIKNLSIQDKRIIKKMDKEWNDTNTLHSNEEKAEYWETRKIPFFGYENSDDWLDLALNRWMEE